MSAQEPTEQYYRAGVTRRQVAHDFMKRRNVVACGLGIKSVGGVSTGEPCVVVSVTRKEPPAVLSAEDLIPPQVDQVSTDVVEVGRVMAQGINRTGVLRPIRPGMSIGHRDGTAGTLGCIVQRDNQRFMLSANHVLALLNEVEIGDPIYQPGPADGSTELNTCGQLVGFVALKFLGEEPSLPPAPDEPQGCSAILSSLLRALSQPQTASPAQILTTQSNYVDVAIASPAPGIGLDPRIIDVGGAPVGLASPTLGLAVIKSGRTTGLTQGRITQVEVTVDVEYDGRVARFTDQVMASPMSQRGDSGSLVLDYERKAVGLLFAGSEAVSIMTPIQTVLAALNVELVTEDKL